MKATNTKKRRKITQYTKAGFVSFAVHLVILLGLVFSIFPKPDLNLEPEVIPLSSYLYVAPKKSQKPDVEILQIEKQAAILEQINDELMLTSIQSKEELEVQIQSNKQAEEHNIAETSTPKMSEVLISDNNNQHSINQSALSKGKSIVSSSAAILKNMQQTDIQTDAAHQASVHRQEQISPQAMPIDKRVDTWAARNELKRTIVYCDNALNTAFALVSGFTQSTSMNGPKVQCAQLPEFQGFIDKRLKKVATEDKVDKPNY